MDKERATGVEPATSSLGRVISPNLKRLRKVPQTVHFQAISYAHRIRDYINRGVRMLVPIQLGAAKPSVVYAQLKGTATLKSLVPSMRLGMAACARILNCPEMSRIDRRKGERFPFYLRTVDRTQR